MKAARLMNTNDLLLNPSIDQARYTQLAEDVPQ